MSDLSDNNMPDLQSLLQQAQAMQAHLVQAKEAAAEVSVVGESGGGKVGITVTGAGEFTGVRIAPELVDDVEMLEDLLLAALRDAMQKVNDLNEEAVGGLFG